MGIIVFLLHAIAPKISMGTFIAGVVPFLVADFTVLIILDPRDCSRGCRRPSARRVGSGGSVQGHLSPTRASRPGCLRTASAMFLAVDLSCGSSSFSAFSMVSADEIQIKEIVPECSRIEVG